MAVADPDPESEPHPSSGESTHSDAPDVANVYDRMVSAGYLTEAARLRLLEDDEQQRALAERWAAHLADVEHDP